MWLWPKNMGVQFGVCVVPKLFSFTFGWFIFGIFTLLPLIVFFVSFCVLLLFLVMCVCVCVCVCVRLFVFFFVCFR